MCGGAMTAAVLTAQVLQDQVELAPCLEGVDQVHDEGVLHLLQDVPLGLGVGRVFSVAYDHSLRHRGREQSHTRMMFSLSLTHTHTHKCSHTHKRSAILMIHKNNNSRHFYPSVYPGCLR